MLIRLIRKCNVAHLDCQLVDILRDLCMYNHESVIGRRWLVKELDISMYPGGSFGEQALTDLFPGTHIAPEDSFVIIDGERLLERSAVVHSFDSGLFLRVVDATLPVGINPDYRLWHGPPNYQATNVDLEIRCGESAYELVATDDIMVAHLQDIFYETEVQP